MNVNRSADVVDSDIPLYHEAFVLLSGYVRVAS